MKPIRIEIDEPKRDEESGDVDGASRDRLMLERAVLEFDHLGSVLFIADRSRRKAERKENGNERDQPQRNFVQNESEILNKF